MTLNRTSLSLCALALLSLNQLAGADQSSAVSKYSDVEVAQIKAVHELGTRLNEYGLSWEDIEPNNLPFDAESYEDCLDESKSYYKTKQEQDVADAQCLLRHPPEWAASKTGQPE
jgi:hypothetical protein